MFCLLNCSKQSGGFVSALFVFHCRVAICYNPTTGLNIGHPILDDHCSQCDTRIQVAIEPNMTDSASVDTPLFAFEFGNDLHCANLWRATNSPGWKTSAQGVERAHILSHSPRDVAHQMHHMAEPLDRHKSRYAH